MDKAQPGHQEPLRARVLDLGYLCLVITSREQTSLREDLRQEPGAVGTTLD